MSASPRLVKTGSAYVASTASVLGNVLLGEDASIWYGAVVRGDDAAITIGPRSNVQDGAVIHVDPGAPNVIGADVTIGHGAICHGVRIEDGALIGMGAVLLSGSVVGEGALIAAGALVRENERVPPWSLAVGIPARVVKTFDPVQRRREALAHAAEYVLRAKEHAAGDWAWRSAGKGPP
jgi:carbonic anhydrase/acetyltransferase-like protein (isoleucine patch superfamily)